MRDGNCVKAQEIKSGANRFSLPMRDGNRHTQTLVRPPRTSFSLPMRDGNPGQVGWDESAQAVLAYL